MMLSCLWIGALRRLHCVIGWKIKFLNRKRRRFCNYFLGCRTNFKCSLYINLLAQSPSKEIQFSFHLNKIPPNYLKLHRKNAIKSR